MKELKFKIWTGTKLLDSGFIISPNGQVYDAYNKHRPDWTPLQFTGFQDQSGQDIYEGHYFECHGRVYDLVRHEGGAYELHERGSDKVFFLFNHHDIISIIGHAHEVSEID